MTFLRNLFKKKASACPVAFRERQVKGGNSYEVYSAPSRAEAMEFLRGIEVKEERKYVIVETPGGNLGKDLIMIFDEASSQRIELGDRKPLPTITKSRTHCAKCGYSVLPAGRPIAGATELILLEDLKESGVGFFCGDCRTAWCPFCVNSATGELCPLCGQRMSLLRE